MGDKIWVKAAHPRASFYQEVLELHPEGGASRLVIEHVHAHTDVRTGEQVPVAVEVTDTSAVRQALLETFPGTENPARIVAVKGKELEEAIAKAGKADAAAAPKKGKGKADAADAQA